MYVVLYVVPAALTALVLTPLQALLFRTCRSQMCTYEVLELGGKAGRGVAIYRPTNALRKGAKLGWRSVVKCSIQLS